MVIVCKCHKMAVSRCEKWCTDDDYIDNYCYEECYNDVFRECIYEECNYDEDLIEEILRNIDMHSLDYECSKL